MNLIIITLPSSSLRSTGMPLRFWSSSKWIPALIRSPQESPGVLPFSARWAVGQCFKLDLKESSVSSSSLPLSAAALKLTHIKLSIGAGVNSSPGLSLHFLFISYPALNSKCITFDASSWLCRAVFPCKLPSAHNAAIHTHSSFPFKEK